jgi:hypothetical protein
MLTEPISNRPICITYTHRLVNIMYIKLNRKITSLLDLENTLELLLLIMSINSTFMCVSFYDIVSSTDYTAVAWNVMIFSE